MQIKKFQQGGSVVAAKKGLNTKELKAAGYGRDVQNNAYYNAKAALRRNTDLRGRALRQAAADQVNALVPAQPAVERPTLAAPAAQLSTPQLAISPIAPLESRAQYTALKVADLDRQEQMRAARQADEAKAAQDAIDAMSFSQAFRQARNASGGRNDGQFTWRGRRFTTNTQKAAAPVEEEIVDNEILLDPAVALQYRENLNNMNTYNALTDISDPALYDVDAMPAAGLSNVTYYTSPTLRSNGMPMRRETVVNPRATLLPGPYNARAVVSDRLINSGDPNNWMIENYDDNSSEFNELSANTTLEGAFDATRRKGSRRALNPGVVGALPANKKGAKLPSCEGGSNIPQLKKSKDDQAVAGSGSAVRQNVNVNKDAQAVSGTNVKKKKQVAQLSNPMSANK